MPDLTTNEVAKKLKDAGIRGGSRPTVIRWSDDGFLPHYRTFGGGYRMYREEVIDLLIKLWHDGSTDMTMVKERLFAKHAELAERNRHGRAEEHASGEASTQGTVNQV